MSDTLHKLRPSLLYCLTLVLVLCSAAFGQIVAEEAKHHKATGGAIETANPSADYDGFTPLVVDDYFRCDVPREWTRIESMFGLSADEKKVYGFELTGPWSGEIPSRITAFYYAEGNLLYKSVDHYLRVFSQPALGVALEGSEYGAIGLLAVSDREGMTFERLKNKYVALNNTIGLVDLEENGDPRVYERREMMARPLPVKERFVVIPAPSGFYALRYSAPEEVFSEHLPAFDQVVTSFHAIK